MDAMPVLMMLAAEPPNLKRPTVVIVMGLDFV